MNTAKEFHNCLVVKGSLQKISIWISSYSIFSYCPAEKKDAHCFTNDCTFCKYLTSTPGYSCFTIIAVHKAFSDLHMHQQTTSDNAALLCQPCRSLSCQSLRFDKHDSHLRLLSLVGNNS